MCTLSTDSIVVQQKPTQHCKAITLQLKINLKKALHSQRGICTLSTDSIVVQQKPTQHCKAIILQLNLNKLKLKKQINFKKKSPPLWILPAQHIPSPVFLSSESGPSTYETSDVVLNSSFFLPATLSPSPVSSFSKTPVDSPLSESSFSCKLEET